MFAPLTLTDILKMIWWGLTKSGPGALATVPATTLEELKHNLDTLDTLKAKPLLVVGAHDHSYRQARLHATTAILCEEKGERPTLHEDHFPHEPPGKGFDQTEGMKLTRVNVVLVE